MSGQQPYNAYRPPVAGSGRKSRSGRKILLILLSLVVLTFGGCTAGMVYLSKKLDTTEEPLKPSVVATLKISGTSKKVTLKINGGPPGFSSGVSVVPPYQTTTSVAPNANVNMSALNGGSEKGTITCSIIVNKKVVATKTAKGPAEMASCSYTYTPAK